MTPNAAFFRYSLILAVFVGCMGCLRAESEYEYAKQLIDINSPSFSTDDMVERLATRLDESASATSKLESKLIKAFWKRRKAGDATVEKRAALLKEASDLYKEVAAGDKKFRLYDTAVKDSDAISMDIIKSQIDSATSNPAEAKKYRAEAGALFDKKAVVFKEEAEKAFPEFQAALTKLTIWTKTAPEGKAPPEAIIVPLDRAFYAWNIPDRRYVQMKVKQVDVLDESDPSKKKIVAEIVAHCQKRIDDENMADFPALTAQYSYLQGCLHASIGSEDAAAKSWNDVLEIDLATQPDDVKKQVLSIFKLVIHDLIKMKMKSKKYADVEEYFMKVRSGPMRTIFEEDLGKDLVIEYAKALSIPAESSAEYEKAVKELRDAIGRERPGSQWSNDFSRAMAEILISARDKKIVLHLSAQEWFDAAHGMHLMGRYIYTQEYEKRLNSTDPKDKEAAKAKYQEAYKEFANAVDYYRRAISEARRADHTPLATRLIVEPKAWFEMGLSYVRMNHDYEAIIAYKAMRDSFLPQNRARWMPSDKKIPKESAKAIKDALAVLDLPKEKDGMLAKSGSNIIFALKQNEKVHKDAWNLALESNILKVEKEGSPLDPDSVTDTDYIVADGDAKVAASRSDSAKQAEQSNDEKTKLTAGDLWKEAQLKFLSSAEKFTKVKPSSPAYDFALVHAAFSLTQAQKIASEGLIPKVDPKDAEKQSKELAEKALEAYKKYDEYVAKNPSTDEKVLGRRKKAQGQILLAKNSLYIGANNLEQAIKTADEYIAFEAENPIPKSLVHIAYLNKFRALISQAAKTPAPESDPFLKSTMATLRDFRAANKSDDKLFVFMLNILSDRFNVAGFQLEKLKKTGTGLAKDVTDKYEVMIDEYENMVADLQSERVDIIAEGKVPGEDLSLDDYSRLVYLFNKTGKTQKAADIAIKLLKRFDPQNKNLRMLDDEKVFNPFLKAMQKIISYPSIDKQERCIKEHGVLVDYMYDTAEGVQRPENDPRRPKDDKLNQNMEKALAKLESIKSPSGEFKDCATLKEGPKEGTEIYKMLTDSGINPAGKSYLGLLEDEIQFRRKIVATRDLLSDLALVVAKKLNKEGNEKASLEYMTAAKEQIEILKDIKGDKDGGAIEVKVAEIDIALGKTAEALNRLISVKPRFDPSSERYFYVCRLISELYADQKKWNEAADYPSFVYVTQGFTSDLVKKRWPDMKAFLKTCGENGAKLPPQVKKALEADKSGAAPAEAPKVDAPKVDATKTEATK